jgi:hypothetical protein
MRLALVAITLLTLTACQTTPQYDPEIRQAGASAQSVMLLPLNVVLPLNSEIKEPSDLVWGKLRDYLGDHGKRVETVSLPDAHRLWIQSIEAIDAKQIPADARFDAAMQALVVNLREAVEFDALIIPSVFVQQSKINRWATSWDGVKRKLEIADMWNGVPRAARSLRGATPCASLHVVVLNNLGEKLFETQAGLETIRRLKIRNAATNANAGGKQSLSWETRPDLFKNKAHVLEGITKALASFLPPLPATPE